MRRLVHILFLLFNCIIAASAQNSGKTPVTFFPKYGNDALLPISTYRHQDTTVTFTTLRFYISGIEFLKQRKTVWKEQNSYYLIDIEDTASMHLNMQVPIDVVYDTIKFHLGIDSLTNTSGAVGGELDPTKGMYWSWQSGYINFKLEGNSPLCSTRNHEFQFHLGGYAAPFASIQTVYLPLTSRQKANIVLDIQKLLSAIDLSVQQSIMIPGNDAVALSRLAASSFSIAP